MAAYCVFLGLVLALTACCAADAAEPPEPTASIIPRPASVERRDGSFTLSSNTAILWDASSPAAKEAAAFLAERLGEGTGRPFRARKSAEGSKRQANAILFTGNVGRYTHEAYEVEVAADRIVLSASGPAGLFYAVQTLLQLLPPAVFSRAGGRLTLPVAVPAARIEDRPRFPWRGLLVDPARHFYTKQELLRVIDLMAMHKYNVLQLHLTDDPGWRLQIKRYPRLTEISAWRRELGFATDPRDVTAYNSKGEYGGFYTQKDVRDIVAYARDRHISVVPEIEMPGHSHGALRAYPEYSCGGGTYEKGEEAKTDDNILCPGNEATYAFVENVLTEVMGLFPSKYIHIGGDEVRRDRWKSCPKCQARIRSEGLKNEDELQSYFTRRVERFLNDHGRVLVGWDEILEGGLAPRATVMSWRGIAGGIAAAGAGHDVIMSPTSHCYLDYYQAKQGEPVAIGGFLPIETVYSYEPVPSELPAEKAIHVLGTQAQVWGEFIPNEKHLDYMTWPRGCALAEVAWSPKKTRDWPDFQARLKAHAKRLDALGVNYRKDLPQPCTWLHKPEERPE